MRSETAWTRWVNVESIGKPRADLDVKHRFAPGVIRIRAVRLLLFGVECIRFPWIRLNAEDLCSTANRRQVGM